MRGGTEREVLVVGRGAKRPDIFISYDRKSSAEETKKLARDLEAAGFSTWWDTQNMRAGDDFYEAIDKHLNLARRRSSSGRRTRPNPNGCGRKPTTRCASTS